MNSAAFAISMILLAIVITYPLGFALGLIYGLVSTAANKVCCFWNDHKFAPLRRRGRRVDEHVALDLVAILRDLASRADIPTPDLYIIDSEETNALAAGRDHRHAAICVTTGLLQVLTPNELAGVLAHEMGHVLRYSAAAKTAAAVLGAGIALLPPLGIFFGTGIVASLALIFITPFAVILAQLAIARAHEYAADEVGARLTGRPDVVARVLSRFEMADDEDVAKSAVAKTLLAVGKRIVGPQRDNPFSSHPLPANRIVALTRLSRDMGLA
jgi:heat shock protein HtpX